MSSEVSPKRVRMCGVADLEVGSALRMEVSGTPVCLVRCDDGFHAVSDICSHEDYSLSAGEVDASQCEIECWKHGSLFSLITGEPLTLPATLPIEVYRVEVVGDDIFVVLA